MGAYLTLNVSDWASALSRLRTLSLFDAPSICGLDRVHRRHRRRRHPSPGDSPPGLERAALHRQRELRCNCGNRPTPGLGLTRHLGGRRFETPGSPGMAGSQLESRLGPEIRKPSGLEPSLAGRCLKPPSRCWSVKEPYQGKHHQGERHTDDNHDVSLGGVEVLHYSSPRFVQLSKARRRGSSSSSGPSLVSFGAEYGFLALTGVGMASSGNRTRPAPSGL